MTGIMFWTAPFGFLLPPTQEIWSKWVGVGGCVFTYVPILIYYQRSPLRELALPIIGALYLAMTWRSALRYWRGERACWKDRQYESKTNY